METNTQYILGFYIIFWQASESNKRSDNLRLTSDITRCNKIGKTTLVNHCWFTYFVTLWNDVHKNVGEIWQNIDVFEQ